jgi:sulfur carrier protein
VRAAGDDRALFLQQARARIDFSAVVPFSLAQPVISLTVNGEPHRFEGPLKVETLLGKLDLAGKRVALERNGEIVPRSRFGEEWVANGDRIEIVVAVGGG